MPAGPHQGELPPPGPLADTGPERPLHPSLCAQAPGCRALARSREAGPEVQAGVREATWLLHRSRPRQPGTMQPPLQRPRGNRTRRPGLAWPPEQGTRPPRASGQCSVSRTGLGASRTFLRGPIGEGASVVAGAWVPGSSGARPGSHLQLKASRSSGHVLLPGPGAGAGEGGSGWRGRVAEVARGGDRGWKPGSRAGARSWSKRTRGPWAGCHLFAGAVWAASSGHPLSGSPRWGWGWSLATRAQPEQPEHRVAGGRLRSSTKCPGALGSQPASARSLCRAERPGPGRPRVRGERDERGERGQLRGLLGPKPTPEHCVNLLKPSDPLE